MLRLLVLSIFLTDVCHALPFARLSPPAVHISKVTFIPALEGLKELQMPLNMLAATPKIEFLGKDGKVLDHCASSVVSDNGHMLSGGHCVDECLSRGNALARRDGVLIVDRARLAQVRCRVRVNGQMFEAEILASNDCRGEEVKSSSANVRCDGLDFAVLKVDFKKAQSLPCFQFGDEKLQVGASVAAIGFPPLTSRGIYDKNARDASGDGPFLTPGQVIPFQNYCQPVEEKDRQGKVSTLMSFGDPVRAALLERWVTQGHIVQTTTDVLRGMSGAGLVDLGNYELAGVAKSYILNNPNQECVGSSFYTSAWGIREAMVRDYPSLDLSEVFRCEKNAFPYQNEKSQITRVPEEPKSPGSSVVPEGTR